MNSKHKKLLYFLKEAKNRLTANELAIKMDMSVRSIKSYISEINQMHPDFVSSNREGYSLTKNIPETMPESKHAIPPQTPQERMNYIVKSLVTTRRTGEEAIDLYELADEMFVSYETVRKDLYNVRKLLQEFELSINVINKDVYLEGNEINIRKMFRKVISQEFNDAVVTEDVIQKAFPDYEVNLLRQIIEECCKKYNFYMNQYSLLNLILDIFISIDRIKSNSIISKGEYQFENKKSIGNREYKLSRSIIESIEKNYCVSYPQVEIEMLSIMLISYLMHIEHEKINLASLEDVVGKDCVMIVNQLLDEIKSYYFIDTQDSDFIIRFAIHINNLMTRLQNGYLTKNALTHHIKTTCPLIFDCAVVIANRIKEITGYHVEDDEIAYIALHIGAILDAHRAVEKTVTCTLVIPQYYDFAETIVDKISENFKDTIIIKEIVTSERALVKAKQSDMIISAIPLANKTKSEYLQITPFMSKRDITNIREMVEKTIKENKKERLRNHLIYISHPDFFYRNKSFSNEKEAIQFMVGEMLKKNYVTDDFLKDVFEREKNSSTAFGHIAVPHAMKMNSPKTGMFVLLNDKAFPWGDAKVNIVLLFSINSKDRDIFHDVFDNLITLLLETANANRLLNCSTYEQFIDGILECS